jgi:glycerol-3-phosphate acyltransferase PlsY
VYDSVLSPPGSYNRVVKQTAAIAIAYLIGSVNFGIVVASLRGIDIRSLGSGNTGTSNVFRALGKKSAAIVLLGDGLKGALAAAMGSVWMGDDFGWVTLFAAVVGHSFPVWHRFKGGKSVATAIGGVAVLVPWVGAVLAVIWIAILVVWRTASIGSLVAMALLVPLVAVSGHSAAATAWAAAIAVFVVVRHADNVKRLVTANERSVSE